MRLYLVVRLVGFHAQRADELVGFCAQRAVLGPSRGVWHYGV